MTIEEAEALLRMNVVAELGEARADELAAMLRSIAGAIALVMNDAVGLEDEDPDFARPLG